MVSLWIWLSPIIAAVCFSDLVDSRAVFAHYMIGTVSDAHAAQDVSDAKAMGLDAFALNIGDPNAAFVAPALSSLFTHAQNIGFKLFISMDLYAAGDSCYKSNTQCHGPIDYKAHLDNYLQHPAYFRGANGKPMVTTFSSGPWENSTFLSWRAQYDVYFVPDFDSTTGYYDAAPGWWNYWGPVVDGVFSWESTWPVVGAIDDGNIAKDRTVIQGAVSHGKSYMMGLSFIQYKNAYGTNLFRHGERTLPWRMQNILGMNPAPLYVQVISWNDGPEGHYIGNLWPEQNTDPQPNTYASQGGAPHNSLQPLITSFINAFKSGSTQMSPPNGQIAGAMWYKTILQSTVCKDDGLTMFYSKPNGSWTGNDALTWAVVVPSNGNGWKIQLVSNGNVIQQATASPGMNIGSTAETGTRISPGAQSLRVLDGGGNLLYATEQGRCVTAECTDDIYNFNPQVVGVFSGQPSTQTCWQTYGSAYACQGVVCGESRSKQTGAPQDSACSAFSNPLTRDLWNTVNTNGQLSTAIHYYTGGDIFTYLAGQVKYTGVTLDKCRLLQLGACPTPACPGYPNGDAAGTAWRHLVVTSVSNMNYAIGQIKIGIQNAGALFASTSDSIQMNFYPTQTPNNLATTELLGGLSTAIGIAATLVGGPAAAILGSLGSAIVGAGSMALTAPTDPGKTVADGYKVGGGEWVKAVNKDIDTAWNTFYHALTPSVMANGTWVDDTQIPALNGDLNYPSISQSDVDQAIYNSLEVAIINWSWTKQNIYIVCKKMQYQDWQVIITGPNGHGSNLDPRLRYWYRPYDRDWEGTPGAGLGCFFQGANFRARRGYPNYPYTSAPAGYDLAAKGNRTWTMGDVFTSSLYGYIENGLNYSTVSPLTAFTPTGVNDPSLYNTKGVWSIPVCMAPNVYSQSEFAVHVSNADLWTQRPGYCTCWNVTDMNGHRLDQFVDLHNFVNAIDCKTNYGG